MSFKLMLNHGVFLLINSLINFIYQNQYKITEIKKHSTNSLYIIVFYSRHGGLNAKDAISLYKDIETLNGFNAKNIAQIGYYASKTHKVGI